jgi:hypothetical protein
MENYEVCAAPEIRTAQLPNIAVTTARPTFV